MNYRTAMSRAGFMIVFIALLSFAAVSAQALAQFSGHCEISCRSDDAKSGGDKGDGCADCVCHQGPVAVFSPVKTNFISLQCVGNLAGQTFTVPEAIPVPIDHPPQLS